MVNAGRLNRAVRDPPRRPQFLRIAPSPNPIFANADGTGWFNNLEVTAPASSEFHTTAKVRLRSRWCPQSMTRPMVPVGAITVDCALAVAMFFSPSEIGPHRQAAIAKLTRSINPGNAAKLLKRSQQTLHKTTPSSTHQRPHIERPSSLSCCSPISQSSRRRRYWGIPRPRAIMHSCARNPPLDGNCAIKTGNLPASGPNAGGVHVRFGIELALI